MEAKLNKSNTLTKSQETILIALSKNMLLPLNDLLIIAQEFIQEDISISDLASCLKKHNSSHENEDKLQNRDNQQLYKTGKNYNLGFINLNIEPLPIVAQEDSQQYLFIAIDMATHWLYFEISDNYDAPFAASFIHNLAKASPFIITRVLTLQNATFTDGSYEKKPTGVHPFDQACNKLDIQHILTQQTGNESIITVNSIEMFTKITGSKHFVANESLYDTLKRYCTIYNEQITQISLEHLTPLQAVQKRQNAKEEVLHTKKPFKLSGVQLLLIWVVWLTITMIFASQAMPQQ
ncbi:MAG: hypothetical protein HQL68_03895 [Magnetococcales bacterium]|nr:hypothetical protein [Magnetococcales bacterium]